MLRNSNDLFGYRLSAVGGEIGGIESFYFDDEYWTVRYLSVDVSSLFPGKRLLVSPVSLGGIDTGRRIIQMTETKDEVLNSPSLPTNVPISREFENRFFSYYSWPVYWGEMGRWGAGTHPSYLMSGKTGAIPEAVRRQSELRDASEIVSFALETAGGAAGPVEGFMVDDDTWAIRYVIADVSYPDDRRKILLSPRWFERIDWENKRIVTGIPLETVRSAPGFDPALPVPEEYESAIARHFGRELEIDPARAVERTGE